VAQAAEYTPLLAGVCSRLAAFFRCNAWALRAVFLLLLMVKTLWTLAVYAGLALCFRWVEYSRGTRRSASKEFMLESPRFESRNRRIKELDRRFREWEDSQRR